MIAQHKESIVLKKINHFKVWIKKYTRQQDKIAVKLQILSLNNLVINNFNNM